MVSVTLDNGAVHELLELHVGEVGTHHHFKHSEELTVRDEAVVVHVINLEGKTELLLARCSSGKGVKSVDEFEEGDASILVLI